MFDLGWMELLVIGVVALIVVGPKDLPVMFRTLGRFTGQARRMAREFSSAMNDAAEDAGVNDLKKDLNTLSTVSNPRSAGIKAMQDAADAFESWDPTAATKSAAPKRPAPPKPAEAEAPAAQSAAPTASDKSA